MEDRRSPAKVIVYKRWRKGKVEGTNKMGTLELDINVGELRRVRGWRRHLKAQIEKDLRMGNVEAINVLAQPVDGCHVTVTLQLDKPGFERKKPVTRGGRPIEGPIPVRTARRVARGNR